MYGLLNSAQNTTEARTCPAYHQSPEPTLPAHPEWNYASMDDVERALRTAVGQDAWGAGGWADKAGAKRTELRTQAAVPMAWVEVCAPRDRVFNRDCCLGCAGVSWATRGVSAMKWGSVHVRSYLGNSLFYTKHA